MKKTLVAVLTGVTVMSMSGCGAADRFISDMTEAYQDQYEFVNGAGSSASNNVVESKVITNDTIEDNVDEDETVPDDKDRDLAGSVNKLLDPRGQFNEELTSIVQSSSLSKYDDIYTMAGQYDEGFDWLEPAISYTDEMFMYEEANRNLISKYQKFIDKGATMPYMLDPNFTNTVGTVSIFSIKGGSAYLLDDSDGQYVYEIRPYVYGNDGFGSYISPADTYTIVYTDKPLNSNFSDSDKGFDVPGLLMDIIDYESMGYNYANTPVFYLDQDLVYSTDDFYQYLTNMECVDCMAYLVEDIVVNGNSAPSCFVYPDAYSCYNNDGNYDFDVADYMSIEWTNEE